MSRVKGTRDAVPLRESGPFPTGVKEALALFAPSTITILTLEPQPDFGSLRAFVSVRMGPALIIHKCRVVQQEGKRAWAGMPQESWKDPSGQRQYRQLVELSGGLKERVLQAILAEAKREGVVD